MAEESDEKVLLYAADGKTIISSPINLERSDITYSKEEEKEDDDESLTGLGASILSLLSLLGLTLSTSPFKVVLFAHN